MFGIDDAILAAAIPAVAGIGSSLMGNLFNRSNADTAIEASQSNSRESAAFNAEQFAKRYQTTAADMKKAGLNPVLAASGGFSVGNAPQMTSAQSFQASPMQSMSTSGREFADLGKAVAETKKAEEETEKVIQDTKKSIAETDNVIQDTLKKREETGLAAANERVAVQNVINMQQQFLKTAEEINLVKAQVLESATKAGLNQAQKWEVMANEKKIQQDTKNLTEQFKILEGEAKRLVGVNDTYGTPIGSNLGILREVMRALLGK